MDAVIRTTQRANRAEGMHDHHHQYSSENLLLIFSIQSDLKTEDQRPNSLTTAH